MPAQVGGFYKYTAAYFVAGAVIGYAVENALLPLLKKLPIPSPKLKKVAILATRLAVTAMLAEMTRLFVRSYLANSPQERFLTSVMGGGIIFGMSSTLFQESLADDARQVARMFLPRRKVVTMATPPE